MKGSTDWSSGYEFLPGDDPKPDSGKLAQLFGDDSKAKNPSRNLNPNLGNQGRSKIHRFQAVNLWWSRNHRL